jgi:hypothetical protein
MIRSGANPMPQVHGGMALSERATRLVGSATTVRYALRLTCAVVGKFCQAKLMHRKNDHGREPRLSRAGKQVISKQPGLLLLLAQDAPQPKANGTPIQFPFNIR